jgi:GTP-binding protein
MTDEGSWADESDWELGAEDVAEAIEEAAAAPPVVWPSWDARTSASRHW